MSVSHEKSGFPSPSLVRATLAEASFNDPCLDSDFTEAERRLGHALPEGLRALYRDFDGFRDSTDAPFFYPLLRPRSASSTSLVEQAEFLRGEDYFPAFVHDAVPIGIDGGGNYWLCFCDGTERIAQWRPSWGNDLEPEPLLESWARASRELRGLTS